MALVNLDLGVGFIHVPRTGGTLFGHVLRFECVFVCCFGVKIPHFQRTS